MREGTCPAMDDHFTDVKIAGTGCEKCQEYAANARKALEELFYAPDVEIIPETEAAAAYGVTKTPALIADGKVLSEGTLLTAAEMKELLEKEGL